MGRVRVVGWAVDEPGSGTPGPLLERCVLLWTEPRTWPRNAASWALEPSAVLGALSIQKRKGRPSLISHP